MRRKEVYRLLVVGMVCGICLFAGCGKQISVEEMYQNLEQPVEETTPVVVDEETAEEKVEFTVSDGLGLDYKVDAVVHGDGIGKMGIYDVEEQPIDEEYLKDLAKNLFDGGNYTVSINPYYMTKDQLEEEIAYFENQPADIKKNYYCQLETLKNCLSRFDESRVVEVTQDQIIYEVEPIEGANFIYFERGKIYLCARLVGYVDGVRTVISYSNFSEGDHVVIESELWYQQAREFPIDESTGYYPENECDINLARTMADAYLKKLKLEGFKESKVYGVRRADGTVGENWTTDGYEFVMTRDIDGVVPKAFENSGVCKGAMISENKTNMEKITINVSKAGVVDVVPNHIVKSIKKSGEAINFISMDQVVEAAKTAITEHNVFPDEFSITYINDKFNMEENGIHEIELKYLDLCYVPIKYDNHTALEPVWVFSREKDIIENHGEASGPVAVIGVSAIDGSAVVFDTDDMYFENSNLRYLNYSF